MKDWHVFGIILVSLFSFGYVLGGVFAGTFVFLGLIVGVPILLLRRLVLRGKRKLEEKKQAV